MKKSGRKSGDERRREIARAVLDLAAERGVAKVTTQAVADSIGVSQATIFRHFKTRDDIFLAAIGLIGEEVFAELAGIFADTDLSPDRRLRAVIIRHLAIIERRKGIPRLLFSDRLHLESPKLKAAIHKMMKTYEGKVASVISEGIDDGSFTSDNDPVLLSQMLTTLIQGLVLRWSLLDFRFSLADQGDVIWKLLQPALGMAGHSDPEFTTTKEKQQ
jgi:TetR/AcrR family transcriptional regulator